jgi:hypothetical protein
MNNGDPVFLGKPLDFYIKWSATVFALLTVYLTSHDFVPVNKYFGIVTAILWLWLGVLWKQPSMWILNIIMLAMYLSGIILA